MLLHGQINLITQTCIKIILRVPTCPMLLRVDRASRVSVSHSEFSRYPGLKHKHEMCHTINSCSIPGTLEGEGGGGAISATVAKPGLRKDVGDDRKKCSL
jgi:hypothetical protein